MALRPKLQNLQNRYMPLNKMVETKILYLYVKLFIQIFILCIDCPIWLLF